MNRIAQVALDAVEPGTRLAAAVCDVTGMVLLAEGAELTQCLIGSLRKRGVSHVPVMLASAYSPEELSAQTEQIKRRVDWLFRNDGGALMGKLHTAVLEYRLREVQ